MQWSTISCSMDSRIFLSLLPALLIAGCVTTPATSPPAPESGLLAAAEDSARLVFLRTHDSKLYLLRKAPVYLDGEKIGDVGYGGWFHRVVSPIQHRLTIRN